MKTKILAGKPLITDEGITEIVGWFDCLFEERGFSDELRIKLSEVITNLPEHMFRHILVLAINCLDIAVGNRKITSGLVKGIPYESSEKIFNMNEHEVDSIWRELFTRVESHCDWPNTERDTHLFYVSLLYLRLKKHEPHLMLIIAQECLYFKHGEHEDDGSLAKISVRASEISENGKKLHAKYFKY